MRVVSNSLVADDQKETVGAADLNSEASSLTYASVVQFQKWAFMLNAFNGPLTDFSEPLLRKIRCHEIANSACF